MKEFIFSFNYTGFISSEAEMIREKTISLGGFPIYTQDLKYPKLVKAIKEKFGEDVEVSDIKYIQIQHSKMYSHSPTNHLVLSFRIKWDTYTEDRLQKLRDELENILKKMNECEKIYFFTTNLFVGYQMLGYIERHIIPYLKQNDFKGNLVIRIQYTGFSITLTSFTHSNYSEIIKNIIENYLDQKYAGLMGSRALNIKEIKLHYFSEGNFTNLEDYLSNELLPFLSRIITDFNINTINFLNDFRNILFDMQNAFDKFDYSTLIDLERYFNDIRSSLDVKFKLFPNLEYGELFFTENPTKLNHNAYLYKNELLSLYKLHYNNFQLYRNNLKDELSSRMDYLRILIAQRRDRIKIYSKSELRDILENIKNEKEFQDILYKILTDMGFTDIKINCGRRGHSEFGKDIVFSHRNMFKHQEWDAIVVKTGKIDQPEGREIRKYIKEIINQGLEALYMPYEDEKGRKFEITRVFIATNDKITDPAKRSISAQIEGKVFFIEKNTLLNLC